ncbi:MAG TPA: energy transducer TonB [Candidatus Angelobacter sp.]|nr:energy transducer TonB [Candidatus Angelobacter sp.]
MDPVEHNRQELSTLGQTQPARKPGWSRSLVVSTSIHVLVLAVLCWPAIPIFIKPSWVAHGEGGNATPVAISLYIPKDIQQAVQSRPSLLSLPASAQKKPQKTRLRKRSNVLEVEKPTTTAEAGSTSGSAYDGPMTGDEVKPALPVTFQDLKIGRSELPGGLPGDVIVEITIDAQGNVIEEKLLQGLGHDVDERVIAALRDWRFHPATRNGVAIPSKHDVHFHFPS